MLTENDPSSLKIYKDISEIHRQQECPHPDGFDPSFPYTSTRSASASFKEEERPIQSAKEILYRLKLRSAHRRPTRRTVAPPLVGRSQDLNVVQDALGRLTAGEVDSSWCRRQRQNSPTRGNMGSG